MKWWQKKIRGWVMPIWVTELPIVSYRIAKMNPEEWKERTLINTVAK